MHGGGVVGEEELCVGDEGDEVAEGGLAGEVEGAGAEYGEERLGELGVGAGEDDG